MQKLIPVEEAKELMREATDWSLWSWLTQKRRLRTTADAAWEALESCERKVKSTWSDDLKKAYRAKDGKEANPELKLAIERMKEADKAWHEARILAEATFDESERRLSTGMACEGARQAIEAWELTEKAIRRAEALGRRSGTAKE
jgi:cell wall assembly regulator SMI1